MKIVITGATGFIGKPALDLLLAHGHDVLSLSRQAAPLEKNGRLRWLQSDLAAPESYGDAVASFQPEACLHLAWHGIPDYSLPTSLLNLASGARLVESLLNAGCKHFAISGSCWEYGKVAGCVSEETQPVDASVFGACKHALHHIVASQCRAANASLAWGRVFYPYGPRQKAASLVPTVCRAIADGQMPSLKTPGAANDFLYVDDTAEALVMLAENSAQGIFNIGSGEATSVGALANELLKMAGRDPVFNVSAAACGSGFWADTRRLRALGWEPRVSLGEGLRRTLDFFTPQC